jgi:predicted esterase
MTAHSLMARGALFTVLLLGTTRASAQIAAPFPDEAGETPENEGERVGPSNADQPWCADGIEALTPTVCHYSPRAPDDAPDTLVIFLHGVVKYGTTWQWNGERAVVRGAKANGFEAIMPRGRLGAGSKKFADYWNWPSSVVGQKQYEDEVIAEWMSAKQALEARNGRPFAHVYVFGFSAGAYYAASLALRGRIDVDGYAVFAGGGAPAHVERWAKGVHPKPPIYVGYGFKDKAHKDPQKLGRALRAMRWPSRLVGKKNVGHSMPDAGVREAIRFLSGGGNSTKAASGVGARKPISHPSARGRRKSSTARARTATK